MEILFALFFVILSGFTFRLRGGGFEFFNGLKFTAVGKILYSSLLASPLLFVNLWVFLLGVIFTLFFVTQGHGAGLNMGRGGGPQRDNFISKFVNWLPRDSWKQDAVYMFISGLSYGIPVAILGFISGLIGILVSLGFLVALGLSKVISYELGWRFIGDPFNKSPLGLAEVLCGALQGVVVLTLISVL